MDAGEARHTTILGKEQAVARSEKLDYNLQAPVVVEMKIQLIVWYSQFVEKLWDKHQVEVYEAEEVLRSYKRLRRVRRGNVRGEDVYLALGQTSTGRYLSVFFVYKSPDAIVISARDMDAKERREYARA